ncbi:TIGR01621 family pseudouridine synthase [Vibrio sagamiensis]|uniref:RNA pseudouridine synthase n=1 Tax=Vibrio sagamiensis NBRC 104589 TaxID=1219064 RepID=A0A511QB64_9VIBR|nr:TIGR01621 family pseudouridine synthase [Vibrio sagamiensis]PNQ61656.1 TIGR01621 family pseudouridine synthase [Vibrio agarivorans]GEM74467.1 RNA pseudouridine synthase [Vibrio sagamiensis NBRC 104589]
MFDILYTHPDFVLINKHPHISVHKDDGDLMLLQEVAKKTGDAQLYLIHRLDKMTSGLLLLGRNSRTASQLSREFAARQVEKFYLAIGSKKPKKKQGVVIGDMERTRRSAWKLNNSKYNPAITQFFSVAAEPGERLFLCKPYTGKTHQIRVALKSVGSSIVGDPIYNPSNEADRGYLHAFCLCFCYQGEKFRFVCDPRTYNTLGHKWQNEVISDGINSWLLPWELNWPTLK